MARRDALLRLHKTLLSRRTALRKALAGELADLRNFKAESGDAVDVAFDNGSEEISSQLAELEARELSHIEQAITQMKRGTYGICEGCQCKIPVSRLNALPYSTTCIDCQREAEHYPGWGSGRGGKDWEKVYDAGSSFEDEREVKLSDLELGLTSR